MKRRTSACLTVTLLSMPSYSRVIPEAARGILTLFAISAQVWFTGIPYSICSLIALSKTSEIAARVKAPLLTLFCGQVSKKHAIASPKDKKRKMNREWTRKQCDIQHIHQDPSYS